MKQFIVLMAVLPIMLVLMLQLTYEQKYNHQIEVIQRVVYSAKEDAKQEGVFTQAIKKRIVEDISEELGIPSENIEVVSSEQVKYRYGIGEDRYINYKVSVRLEEIMAGQGLLIDKEDNHCMYVIDSYTTSEKL